MFLWVGLLLDENYGNNIKSKCIKLNKSLLLDEKAFELPTHISLKISFQVNENQKEEIINEILLVVRKYLPLKVTSSHIERNNNIIWSLFENNQILCDIHNELDDRLLKRGIQKHIFDENFIFHSTLFMDDCNEKINAMYKLIKDMDIKSINTLDTIIIGSSDDGVNFKVELLEKV